MRQIEGNLVGTGLKIGIVAARFNDLIVSKLIQGAEDGLVRHGVLEDDITLVRVPGAFEIPYMAKQMGQSGQYHAIICLGAVIRGETSHYDYVCSEVSKGIAAVSLDTEVPVLFGVLTTDTIEQAASRAGSKGGNKGFECAQGAIELANLKERFQEEIK